MSLILDGSLGVTVDAGTAALPAVVSATGTADTGIWFPAADTVAASTAGTERLRIDSSGNVGIGTTSPGAKLEVKGAGFTAAYISSDSTSESQLRFYTNTSARISQQANQALLFDTNATERMRIDSSGNLLVGVTSTIGGLNASGHFKNVNAGAAGIVVGNAGGTSTTNAILFTNSNGTVGGISTNGSATSYNTSSDYRLKNTIAPMTGALGKVALLKPVTYKWNADGSDGQGFIAHELDAVVPGCVTGVKDATREEEYEVTPAVPAVVDAEGVETTPAVQAIKGTRTVPSYQGIDTSFLVATLTAALQEAHGLIKNLEQRMAVLEAKA